jgi:intracellular sulfur oxidation DsrE/DsrF family protein
MRKLAALLVAFFAFITLHAQTSTKDSTTKADSTSKISIKAKADSAEKALLAKATYPLIKSGKYSGVLPVDGITEKPDVNQQFKLLLEVANGPKDSLQAKELNDDLVEVARQLNLHIAAGIPKKNIDIVVVAHGGVLKALFTDSAYNKKYKINNPNDTLLNELRNAGVKFIVCGQAMNFQNVQKSQLFPWIKIALSAQIVITDYQLKGYIHRDLSEK